MNPFRRIRDHPRRPIGMSPGVPVSADPAEPAADLGRPDAPSRARPPRSRWLIPARPGPIRAIRAIRGRIRPVPPAHSLAGLPRPGTDHSSHFDRRGPIPEKDSTTDCTDFTDRGQEPNAGPLGARGSLDSIGRIARNGEPERSAPNERAGRCVACSRPRSLRDGPPHGSTDSDSVPDRAGGPTALHDFARMFTLKLDSLG